MQTEDSGLTRLYVTTHLFYEGTILATARAQYTTADADEVVQKKMQAQHKTMLKRLRDGDFDNVEAGGRPVKPTTDSSADFAVPRELLNEAPTLRNPVPAPPPPPEPVDPVRTTMPTGPVLAPVAPPPSPPRPSPTSGSLAERLRRPPGTPAVSVPPPLPGLRPAQPDKPAGPAVSPPPLPRAVESAPVVELEAALPDDDDDLEPAVTIEVAEPVPDQTLSFGAAALPLDKTSPPPSQLAAVKPVATAPAPPPALVVPSLPPVVPLPSPPQLSMRALVPAGLRTRPSAEGVVLQRTLVPTPSARTGADSVRTTSPRARPTSPAPLAVAQSISPQDDERGLDPVVLAYLAREVRK